MKSNDFLSSLFLFVIAVLACVGATKYHVGSFSDPQAGSFPFLMGLVIGVLSLAGMLKALQEGGGQGQGRLGLGVRNWKQVVYVSALLTFCGLILEGLGYLLTVSLFFALLLILNYRKWYVVIGGTLIASVGSYLVFRLALQVELPRGLLGY
jgi:hypothetical protein